MRIVIVEDEPAAARQLKKMLERAQGLSIDSLSICSSLAEAKKAAREGLDLMFLDLNLMGKSGFELFGEEFETPFETIVTTAYPEHALDAFGHGVRDYLVKPFSQERLEQAIERVPKPAEEKPSAVARIMVKDRDGITPVDVGAVSMIRSAGDYCELYLDDGTRRLCSKRMDYLEQSLPEDFLRVHRTAIVRLSKIKSLKVEGGGRYLASVEGIENPAPVGRKYYKSLKDRLGE